MKKLVILLLVVAFAAAGWGGWRYYEGRGKDKKGFDDHPPVSVSVAPAEVKDVPFSLSTVGSVVTYQSVAVRSRIDSQLMEVKFRDGDTVNAGDLLFVLDDRALNAQLRELEANLARDRAQLANLQQQYDRKKGLAGKGYETTANLDDARAQAEAQRAAVAATEATIENLKVQLEYTKILAPIGGRTGTINVTPGNTVKANDATPLVTINQVKPIRVQVAVPQQHLAALRAALEAGAVSVTARHEGDGDTFSTGTLDYIDNTIDQSTGTFMARASFANDNEKLWPGMFVTVTIVLGDQKGVVTVPEVAIQHGQDGDFVFVTEGGKAVKKPVKLDRMQGGLAVIASGVAAGDPVVVDGMMRLENGSDVVVGGAETSSPEAEPEKAAP